MKRKLSRHHADVFVQLTHLTALRFYVKLRTRKHVNHVLDCAVLIVCSTYLQNTACCIKKMCSILTYLPNLLSGEKRDEPPRASLISELIESSRLQFSDGLWLDMHDLKKEDNFETKLL